MNPKVVAARAGVARGGIELRQTFTTPQDVWGYLFPSVVLLVVMFFTRGSTFGGTTFSLGAMMLPSVLGMGIAFSGLMTLTQVLTFEREDGTLLRAKAVPGGMLGYLVGKVVLVSGMSLVSFLIVLIPGLIIFDGLALNTMAAWATLAWVVLVGLVATMPLGAVLGSLFNNPRNIGLVMLPIMGLVATSGIFYPLTNYPEWLQWVGQTFPIYWLGLGMRSALLPDEMMMVEIGQSWRHLETLGVLGVWAVIGFTLAPIVLRRMARRESGSTVAARRDRAMQQIR
jgi:ABC-2 type transport system permease protein